jgi:hypothetical protein
LNADKQAALEELYAATRASETRLKSVSPEEHLKIRLLLVLVGLAIAFATPTFAQQKETPAPPESE